MGKVRGTGDRHTDQGRGERQEIWKDVERERRR